MNWTRSVVSRQLESFEQECGGRLFDRNARGMALTDLGRMILPKIDTIIDAADRITSNGAAPCGKVREEVRVVASSSIAQYLWIPLLKRAQQKYPHICLRLGDASFSEPRTEMIEERADIAVFLTLNACKPEDRRVGVMEAYLIGRPGSAASERETIDFASLASLPMLLPPHPSEWRTRFDQVAARKKIDPMIAAELSTPMAAYTLVHAGLGYVIWPLAPGQAAEKMGWFAGDVQAGRLAASRIVAPGFAFKLLVGTCARPSRGVLAIADLVEDLVSELGISGHPEVALENAQ